jgi:helix-turn-helix protein
LYGRATWSVTIREEHALQESENQVLMKVSGLKTDELSEQFRILNTEELSDLYRPLVLSIY